MTTNTTYWSPGDYFTDSSSRNFALIVLNQPITNVGLFLKIWNNAKIKVCADGGANRLFGIDIDGDHLIPDCITGDLDSITPEIKSYYESRNVEIIDKSDDQYSTDFTKALDWITERSGISSEGTGVEAVIAYGATGGRVDQMFHSIHQLFVARSSTSNSDIKMPEGYINANGIIQNEIKERKLYLLSDESITFLLEPGNNIIKTPLKYFGKTCGIIPIFGPIRLTLRGFEWDLEDCDSRFGGMVSTSNHLIGESVEVEVDGVGLFTMEVRS